MNWGGNLSYETAFYIKGCEVCKKAVILGNKDYDS